MNSAHYLSALSERMCPCAEVFPPVTGADVSLALSKVNDSTAADVRVAPSGECTLPGGAAYVMVDLQCQGFVHDRCVCEGGHVRCVAASATFPTLTLPRLVSLDLLERAVGGEPLPWCDDGDMVAGWYLLQVRPLYLGGSSTVWPILQTDHSRFLLCVFELQKTTR